MAEGPSSVSLRDWGEGVLDTYFKLLSGFAHDQSKDLAEKEKAAQQTQPTKTSAATSSSASTPPSPQPSSASACRAGLLNVLCQLSQAEKAYHSLYFFVAKGFLRKDSSLRSSFDRINAELALLKVGIDWTCFFPTILLSHIGLWTQRWTIFLGLPLILWKF